MKKAFIYFFEKWWRPLLFFGIIAAFLIINSELNIRILKKPLGFLSNVSAIILLISFCYQLYKRRFLKGFATLFIVFTASLLSTMATMIDGDHWADDLEIPSGIQLDDPANKGDYVRPDRTVEIYKNQTDLALYNSGQPGMYEFDFWTGKIDSGTIYLKAFEITQEEELSTDWVKENTEIPIYNEYENIIKFSSTRNFTIYEGDWGKFYSARFEVWFKPNAGGEEIKLFQKNFKIEGWMH